MAKGDDAVQRRRSKSMRKRLRSDESAVSARIASIIAAKQRRKTGKRRMCQGMCFSLPTPDDPFNERHGKKDSSDDNIPPKNKKIKPIQQKKKPPNGRTKSSPGSAEKVDGTTVSCELQPLTTASKKIGGNVCADNGDADDERPSKFLILCLNAIQDAWKEQEQGACDGGAVESLLVNKWGVELWKCCSAGSSVLDTTGTCASREKIAWLVSTASDMIAKRDKQGHLLPSPFLLYLVSTQEKALQVRSICKPLKALGIHTVSLHAGSSIKHQVNGLKSCEPEFLVSTPERLLELISLRAIDISGISILVLDGLLTISQFIKKINEIRLHIAEDPQVILFSDSCNEVFASFAKNLIRGPVSRLSEHDTIASQSAFISQIVHLCTAEEEKMPKAKEILAQAFISYRSIPRPLQVLLIARTAGKAQVLTSYLKNEGYAICDDLPGDSITMADSEESSRIFVKDAESLDRVDLHEFESVILLDFPPSIENYVDILKGIARHSVSLALHTLFCEEDAPLAPRLIEVLIECNQVVPKDLRRL